MKTNQTRQQPATNTADKGGYAQNPVQLLQNKKSGGNPFQLLQKKATGQPVYNPIQLIVQTQKAAVKGRNSLAAVQRFQVRVQTNAANAAEDTITSIGFKDRPGHTNIGGDPYGANRHVISVQLEFKAVQSMFEGKSIGYAAGVLKCNPSALDVQNAIKAKLAGDNFKSKRLLYQGSGAHNSSLQNFTSLAESEMRRYGPEGPTPDAQKYAQAVKLAFVGTFDSPPDHVKQLNLDKISGAIDLHRYTIQHAYKIPDEYMPDEAEMKQLFLHLSSDEMAQKASGMAESLRAGGGIQNASLFGHFTQSDTRQQPVYSLGASTSQTPQINSPQHTQTQPYGVPQQQQLLPSIHSLVGPLPPVHNYATSQQQGGYQTAPLNYQLQPPTNYYNPPFQQYGTPQQTDKHNSRFHPYK